MLPSFSKNLGPINLEKIIKLLNAKSINSSSSVILNDLVSINSVSSNTVSFLYDNQNLPKNMPSSSYIICSNNRKNELDPKQKILIVNDVHESIAIISNIFYRDFNSKEIDNFPKPSIGSNCEIANNVTIENGAIIGNNVSISHGTVIKHSCIIGTGCKIGSNNVISNSIIAENVNIENNVSIGQPGFGFHLANNNNIKIYHKGKVILQDNVSIGSGCAIDRGSFSDTFIGKNTFLDNLCHIAHNVQIGNNSTFAAMTGIAGSTRIGENVLTGGQTGIAGHLSIGNQVHIAAKSGVFKNLNDGEVVMGNPAIKKYKYIKTYKKIYEK